MKQVELIGRISCQGTYSHRESREEVNTSDEDSSAVEDIPRLSVSDPEKDYAKSEMRFRIIWDIHQTEIKNA